jgi:hypothetical protein
MSPLLFVSHLPGMPRQALRMTVDGLSPAPLCDLVALVNCTSRSIAVEGNRTQNAEESLCSGGQCSNGLPSLVQVWIKS